MQIFYIFKDIKVIIVSTMAVLLLSTGGCLTYLHIQKKQDPPDRIQKIQKAKKDGVNFKAYYLNQKPFFVSDYLGKVVLINFWATWCGPCVEELPSLNNLAKQYPDELVVLAISDERADDIKNFLMSFSDFHSNFILSNKSRKETQSIFNIKMLPESYILNKKGILVERVVGPQQWDSKSWLQKIQKIITQ